MNIRLGVHTCPGDQIKAVMLTKSSVLKGDLVGAFSLVSEGTLSGK